MPTCRCQTSAKVDVGKGRTAGTLSLIEPILFIILVGFIVKFVAFI
jgi:uncharacterized membrane protein